MKVLIIRHGPAGDKRRWARTGQPDTKRPLTAKGREKTRRASKGLRRVAPSLDLIVTSPLIRARQTAQIVAKAVKLSKILEIPELKPEAAPAALLHWLQGRREASIAVVGHEPQLGRFIAWVCARSREPLTVLKKGQCALLDIDAAAGHATLLWSLKPSQLRLLAR